MTDEKMRQLEALAQAVLAERENVGELFDHLGPRDVLALIERVRKAEARAERGGEAKLQPALDMIREPLTEMGCTFPGGGFVGIAEGIREVVAKAERRGAEGMREAAATVHDGQCASQGFSGLSTAPWHRRYAAEIRGLPLPGDPP